jgi:predicted phosphodiesterase
MGNRILKYIGFGLLLFLLSSCSSDADFSGLIRSTDRVEKRFEQSMQWNAEHPFQTITCTENDYSVLVAADSHIGGTENFSYLKSLYNEEDFLVLMLVGDIVSGQEEDYLSYVDLIENITKPIFPVTGNHDLYFDGWKNFYKYLGSSTYYFVVETSTAKDIYICLDSGGGTFGKSQINWLEELLEDIRTDYRYCTVMSHVNMFRTRRTTSANPITEEVVYLLDLFTQHNVDYVVNGHDHLQDELQFGNTTYLILDALKDEYINAGYAVLNINEDEIQHEFVRLN